MSEFNGSSRTRLPNNYPPSSVYQKAFCVKQPYTWTMNSETGKSNKVTILLRSRIPNIEDQGLQCPNDHQHHQMFLVSTPSDVPGLNTIRHTWSVPDLTPRWKLIASEPMPNTPSS